MSARTVPEESAAAQTAASRGDNLALLYQGMLTGIVRIQSGRQPIGDPLAFQRRMEDLLIEIEREAVKVGYQKQEIDDAHYAVIAFLDETVLSSRDPSRTSWTSLAAKVYQQAIAGDGIFDRLRQIRSRRDSRSLADVLEVYFLIFALGYEGRYAVTGKSELQALMGDIREQIDRIRGRQDALSPEGGLPARRSRASTVDRWLRPLAWSAGGSVIVAALSWLTFKMLLNSTISAFAPR